MSRSKKVKISYKTKIAILRYLPGMHYIEVPAKIVKTLGGKLSKRLICTINKKEKFQCGLMALGEGRGYIMVTKKRLKELSLAAGSPVLIELVEDKSKYGMQMCDELIEVLKQDAEAADRFDKLTPGKQRNIIHYVGTVKNSDKRIERAFQLLENLKLLPLGKESMAKMLGVKNKISF